MSEHENLARANKAARSPEVKAANAISDKAGFRGVNQTSGGMTVIRKGMSPDRSLNLQDKADKLLKGR